MTIILSNLNRFTHFFTRRFLSKFAVKWILNNPPHPAYVTTLLCETLTSAKQANNDTLQSSVTTCIRCGEVVNKQIKKHLLLSLRVQKNLKSVNIWQSYKQKRDCLVHFVRLLHFVVCWSGAQSAWDNHALACNFVKYSPIKKNSLTHSAINLSYFGYYQPHHTLYM